MLSMVIFLYCVLLEDWVCVCGRGSEYSSMSVTQLLPQYMGGLYFPDPFSLEGILQVILAGKCEWK